MRRIMVVSVLVVAGLLGGVTGSSVTAAQSTTVTWKVSSLTVKATKNLSDIASSNSTGRKTWSSYGSCRLSPASKPTKLIMGSTGLCGLTLKIAQSGQYPAKSSTRTILRKGFVVSGFTVMPNVNLQGVIWSYANLSGVDLRNTNLAYANLRGTDLRSANLSGADLRNTNLAYADLTHADLTGADLSGANLYYAYLIDTIMPDGWRDIVAAY